VSAREAADQGTTFSITIAGGRDQADLVTGVLDALRTFGVLLANGGLVERAAIADAMARSLDQLTRQPINTPARRFALEAMHAVFAAPVMEGGRGRAGLVSIDGGRKDPPDDTPGAA